MLDSNQIKYSGEAIRVHSILEIGVICSQFLTGTDLNFVPVERVLKNLLDTGLLD